MAELVFEVTDVPAEQRAYEAKYDPTWYSQICHRYQDTMEELLAANAEMPSTLDLESVDRFKNVHGACPFVCRYPKCIRAFDGFSSSSQRDQHEILHYRRWKCGDPNCLSFETGFNSARALVQHNQTQHWTPTAFPRFNKSIDPPSQLDDGAASKEKLNPKEKTFICSGTLPSRNKWGCGETFSNAAALKAHFRTTIGFNCIQELYSETATSISQEDLQPPQNKIFFSSNCHGTLNSGIEWGCKRNFASEWSLLQHWQSNVGRRCRQALNDEVDSKLKMWEEDKSVISHLQTSRAQIEQFPSYTLSALANPKFSIKARLEQSRYLTGPGLHHSIDPNNGEDSGGVSSRLRSTSKRKRGEVTQISLPSSPTGIRQKILGISFSPKIPYNPDITPDVNVERESDGMLLRESEHSDNIEEDLSQFMVWEQWNTS